MMFIILSGDDYLNTNKHGTKYDNDEFQKRILRKCPSLYIGSSG